MKKVKSLRSNAMGFGFDPRMRDNEESPMYRKAMDITLKFMDMADNELGQLSSEDDKGAFIYHLHYNLCGLLACVYDSLGIGYNKKEDFEIPQDLSRICSECDKSPSLPHYARVGNAGWSSAPGLLDHVVREKTDSTHYRYISNPETAIHSELLEKMIPALSEKGYRFSISAWSNYFPSRSLKLVFDKVTPGE
jgi:hypothetical protein